jgi:hypothetical protein
MKAVVHHFIPFDLGLELDFVGKDAKEIAKEVSSRAAAPVGFEGRQFPDAQVSAQIYKFGVGLIQVSFPVEGDLDFFADLACRTEALTVGKSAVGPWSRGLVDGLIKRAREFASHAYDRRLEDFDMFPAFVLEKGEAPSAVAVMEKHSKALYGIVAGEPHYERLSDFVLQREGLVNLGYYENELILIKRFGAVVSSGEAGTVLELIRLAYALYWNLRAYNHFLDREIDQAQSLLAHLPPYHKFWAMPRSYQRFSREAIDFVRDKLAIVDSLYNVAANIPRVDSDWHLRTIYKNVEKEFDVDDLAKAVDAKLERIEQSYNSARDFISTNFFIAVEIVLILSLAWMMFDTALLFIIARK